MTVHPARVIVLVAVLVSISALGPSTLLQAQQPLADLPLDQLRALVEQGDVEAQRDLAFRCLSGLGVLRDDAEAVRLYQLAANQGNAVAQFNLGVMYADGRGVLQDATEAVRLFQLAADQGNAAAQNNLGNMYYNGRGVPQDYAEAVRLFRLSADEGDAIAQGKLGVMYTYGEGVLQDYVEAHMWYNLAAAQQTGEDRDRTVMFRDNVAELMTAEQIAEAQRRAREWKPTPEP